MTIILVGLNHRTAPVELREKLALNACTLQIALESFGTNPESKHNSELAHSIREGVILSTCNRLEVYAVVTDRDAGCQAISEFIAGMQELPVSEISPHLYHYEGMDAVRHLMDVSCGLDSMILGEPQILGQVTQAFSDAQTRGLTGPVLSHLLSQAIHAGKRARTETAISRFTTSVSHAGALLVLDKLTISSPNILIVGAGEMAVLAAKSLQKLSTINLAFLNRTYSRAEALAGEVGGVAFSWNQLDEALVWADAIITATDAPHTIIYARDVEDSMVCRNQRPLVFVDIAVPRDVEATVGEVEGVERYDIDHLQGIVDTNTSQREAAIPQVKSIIHEEIGTFFEWYHSREVTPVIKDLRQWATDIAQAEVTQALNKLGDVDENTEKVINLLAHRLVNKLLHKPTVTLRGQAAEGNGYGYAHALSELFDLHTADLSCEDCPNGSESRHDEPCRLDCIVPGHKSQF